MPKRLTPQKYSNDACNPRCSLHKDNVGEEQAAIIHGWFESGLNDDEVLANASKLNIRLSRGSCFRHRKNHLQSLETSDLKREHRALSDVEALKAIIERGQEFIPTWRITPTEYFKALDLYYKLTKGSAFDGLMSSLAAAANELDDEEPGVPEGDPATGDFDIAER